MKNIEDLLNQTFVYDTIQDLEEKNKYLLEKIERLKKGIKNILNDLYQSNYDLKFKNKFIEEVLHLESLSLENDNQYENIEDLLNQTFVYDTIQDLEEKNKYLLEKIERLKKGIKNILNDLYQSNYDLKFKNKFIEVFESLEKLESFLEDNDSNDNKYEELENLKQKNHELNQKLILKEKQLEDFKLDNKNYEKQINELNKAKQDLTEQLNKVTKTQRETQSKLDQMIYANEDLINQLDESQQQLNQLNKEKQDLTDEIQSLKETETSNEKQINELNKGKQDLTEQLNKVTKTQRETQSKLDQMIYANEDLINQLDESLLIKNSDYYQKLKYISEPIIVSKHKDNNWNIETLPNIKDKKIEKTILLNIEENKILNNLIEQKNNITIIFCKKTKKFKEAFFINKYQNKIIINIENEQQKILEKLNYKIRTEMASSLTQSDINKINNFNNQKEPKKSPYLTNEELKKYQNQGAVPKHYKLV